MLGSSLARILLRQAFSPVAAVREVRFPRALFPKLQIARAGPTGPIARMAARTFFDSRIFPQEAFYSRFLFSFRRLFARLRLLSDTFAPMQPSEVNPGGQRIYLYRPGCKPDRFRCRRFREGRNGRSYIPESILC